MQGLPTRVNLTPVKFNLLSSLLLSSSSSSQSSLPAFSFSLASFLLDLVRIVLTLSVLFFVLYFRGGGVDFPLLPLSLFLLSVFSSSSSRSSRSSSSASSLTPARVFVLNTISIRRRVLIIASKPNQLDTQFVPRLIEPLCSERYLTVTQLGI